MSEARMKCAVLDDYQGAALEAADWSVLDGQVEVRILREHLSSEEDLASELADCDVLVVMRERTPITASLLRRLPKVRLIVTSGMRNASIDRAAAAVAGVTVCGTKSSSEPPAELTWALILALARGLPTEFEAFRTAGPWQSTVGRDLNGARLGLVGLGRIGSRVAAVGAAFGMEVLAWSPNLTDERAAVANVRRIEKDELFNCSDIVSVHLVLSDRTRGLIGRDEIERMRQDAFLVNTSRAAIVDHGALIDALQHGRIGGAGLDVFDAEPLPADDALRNMPNVVATPHLGYVTHNNYRTYFRQAVEDIEAFLAGAPIRELA